MEGHALVDVGLPPSMEPLSSVDLLHLVKVSHQRHSPHASFSITMTSSSKTAEFARLLDLFERCAAGGSRSRSSKAKDEAQSDATPDDDANSIHIPAELESVFRSLATLVSARHPASDQSTGRRRRNTVAARPSATTISDDADHPDSDEESVAKFPLGKQFPFTFKLMLHKLYELDEWAEKVRDVLTKSKMEYKPLAEQKAIAREVENWNGTVTPDGHVRFDAGVAAVASKARRGNLPQGRPRSHTIAGSGGKAKPMVSGTVESIKPTVDRRDDVRALKKRCVGRRKSFSEPATPGPIGSAWIYDAAVSVVESTHRGVELAHPVKGPMQVRPRYQSLESAGRRMPAIRRTFSAAPGSVWDGPPKPVGGSGARRRGFSIGDIPDLGEGQPLGTKRPLM